MPTSWAGRRSVRFWNWSQYFSQREYLPTENCEPMGTNFHNSESLGLLKLSNKSQKVEKLECQEKRSMNIFKFLSREHWHLG